MGMLVETPEMMVPVDEDELETLERAPLLDTLDLLPVVWAYQHGVELVTGQREAHNYRVIGLGGNNFVVEGLEPLLELDGKKTRAIQLRNRPLFNYEQWRLGRECWAVTDGVLLVVLTAHPDGGRVQLFLSDALQNKPSNFEKQQPPNKLTGTMDQAGYIADDEDEDYNFEKTVDPLYQTFAVMTLN